MNQIQLELDWVPNIEYQCIMNLPMQENLKKEISKWLDEGVICLITNKKLVSLVQCVPKKGRISMVPNKKNELIPIRPVTGFHVWMDYKKLNVWTEKNHFLVSFMDQILDYFIGREWYYFLDGYSGYNLISITTEGEENTTFTYPYGTFMIKRMSFVCEMYLQPFSIA